MPITINFDDVTTKTAAQFFASSDIGKRRDALAAATTALAGATAGTRPLLAAQQGVAGEMHNTAYGDYLATLAEYRRMLNTNDAEVQQIRVGRWVERLTRLKQQIDAYHAQAS